MENTSQLSANIIPLKSIELLHQLHLSTIESEGGIKTNPKALPKELHPNFDLDKPIWIYSEAQEHTQSYQWNLHQTPAFARKYYHQQLFDHFAGTEDILVRFNFISDLEVWVRAEEQNNPKFTLYNTFSLRVQHARFTKGLELMVAFSGQTSILNQSIETLDSLPEKIISRSQFRNIVYPQKHLPDSAHYHMDEVFPIISYQLRKHLKLPFPKPNRTANRYKCYHQRIESFYQNHLNQTSLREIIPLSEEGFINLPQDRVSRVPVTKELVFGEGNTSDQPIAGMRKYGPAKLKKGAIRFFFIYPASDPTITQNIRKAFKEFLAHEQGSQRSVFASFIRSDCKPHPTLKIVYTNNHDPLPDIKAGLDFIKEPDTIYFAFFITPFPKHTYNFREKRVYHQVKELLLIKGIPNQVIFQNTLQGNFKISFPNIAIAMLAKMGGIPWRLKTPTQKELIIGVGAYFSREKDQRIVGSAICFSNSGEFNGFRCFKDHDPRVLAGSIAKAVRQFQKENQETSRVVIHYYKQISRRELEPIENALHGLQLPIPIIIVTISTTENKDYVIFDHSSESILPLSGTITKIGKRTFLLNNNARFSPTDTVKWNQGYPFPSKLHFNSNHPELLEDQATINTLIEQVHQFSRLYWKSVTQQSTPVTVLYPRLAAQHMAHFSINQVPDHSINLAWFL